MMTGQLFLGADVTVRKLANRVMTVSYGTEKIKRQANKACKNAYEKGGTQ